MELLFDVHQAAMESLGLIAVRSFSRTLIVVLATVLEAQTHMSLTLCDTLGYFSLIDTALRGQEVAIAATALMRV